MYSLSVYYPGDPRVRETLQVATAQAAVDGLPPLLLKHATCHRIEVSHQAGPLFAVDCYGSLIRR